MELKLKMSMTIIAAIKKCLIPLIIQLNQNAMIIQTNYSLAKRNIKQEAFANEEFFGLKPKIYLFSVEKIEHKKAKNVNKNVNKVKTIE